MVLLDGEFEAKRPGVIDPDNTTEPADEIPAISFKSIRYTRTALDLEGIRPSDNGVH